MISNKHFLSYDSLKPFKMYLQDEASQNLKFPRFKIITQLNSGEEYKQANKVDQSMNNILQQHKSLERINKTFIPFISERDSMGRIITHSKNKPEIYLFHQKSVELPLLSSASIHSSAQTMLQYQGIDQIIEPLKKTKGNIKYRSKKLLNDIKFGKRTQKIKSNQILGLKNTEFIATKQNDDNLSSSNKSLLNESVFKIQQKASKSTSKHIPEQDSILSLLSPKEKSNIKHQPKLLKVIDRSRSVPSIGHYQTGKSYENNIFPRTRQTIISPKNFDQAELKINSEEQKLLKLQQSQDNIVQRNAQKLKAAREQQTDKNSETDQIYAQLHLPSVGSSKKYIKEFLDRNRHLVLNVHPINDYQGFPKDFEYNLIQQKKHIRGLRQRIRAWGNNEKDNKQELQEQAQKILENARKY